MWKNNGVNMLHGFELLDMLFIPLQRKYKTEESVRSDGTLWIE